jgi:hypothetical protein
LAGLERHAAGCVDRGKASVVQDRREIGLREGRDGDATGDCLIPLEPGERQKEGAYLDPLGEQIADGEVERERDRRFNDVRPRDLWCEG